MKVSRFVFLLLMTALLIYCKKDNGKISIKQTESKNNKESYTGYWKAEQGALTEYLKIREDNNNIIIDYINYDVAGNNNVYTGIYNDKTNEVDGLTDKNGLKDYGIAYNKNKENIEDIQFTFNFEAAVVNRTFYRISEEQFLKEKK